MEKQNIKSTLSQIYYNTHPIILKWIFANLIAIMFFFVLSTAFIA